MISVIPYIHADVQRLRKPLAMTDPVDRIVFLECGALRAT
jgi:hypothetical protein